MSTKASEANDLGCIPLMVVMAGFLDVLTAASDLMDRLMPVNFEVLNSREERERPALALMAEALAP